MQRVCGRLRTQLGREAASKDDLRDVALQEVGPALVQRNGRQLGEHSPIRRCELAHDRPCRSISN